MGILPLKIIDNQRIAIIHPELQNTRSQDLELSYFDAGQFYWLQGPNVLINKKIYTNYSGYIILDELHAQDIDNNTDWELAELKYKLINLK